MELKNLGLPEHIFRYFRRNFHDLLFKNQGPQRFLIKQLFCEWWVTEEIGASVQLSLANRRSKRRLQFQSQKTRKNGGNLPASNFTIDFFIWGATYLLKHQSYMYKTDGWDGSAVVTHHPQSNCQMRNQQTFIFKIKTWKWYQKAYKICSDNHKFFYSFIYNPLWPVSISIFSKLLRA